MASFCKMTGLTGLFPQSKIVASYYLGHLPEEKTNVVDVLSGAFMMIDKKVLDTVGSFDEDYFMYAEDIDLSYRIQKSGYKNLYFADTTIIHFKGESTAKQSASYIQIFMAQ
ncbi:MAG: glycosyltransferase [Chitinophagaceae bacterium]|nr:glycosyltransferase [Chitinophagaceae bacterium]